MSVTRSLIQMMMMPWNAMVMSMEMFTNTMRGMQQGFGQSADSLTGGGQYDPSGQGGAAGAGNWAGNTSGTGQGFGAGGNRTTDEETDMRNQDWDRRGQDWSQQEGQGWGQEGQGGWGGDQQQWGGRERQGSGGRDRQLGGDDLKLVRYKILFIKRDLEAAFPDEEELITDSISATQFAGLKIAKFLKNLPNTRRPDKWRERGYPSTASGDMIGELPAADEKYLRIYFEVLERYQREEVNYDREQVEVLRDIRDELARSGGRAGGPVT